jgi:hypothetical protein
MESSMIICMTVRVRVTEAVLLVIMKLRKWQTWARAAAVRSPLFDDFQPNPDPGKQYEGYANT